MIRFDARALALLLLPLAVGSMATRAYGQPAVEGSTFTVFSRSTVTRFPDVAYDAAAGLFLVVSGQQGVTGRFVSSNGVEGNEFPVTSEPTAYSPRVASVGNGFLVCWYVEVPTALICRRVKPSASGPSFDPEEIVENSGGGKHLESAPSLSCAVASNECLVPWVDASGGTDLRARRVDLAGKPIGSPFDVSVTAGLFEAFPSLAFSAKSNEYLVVHTLEPGSLKMAIAAERVKVGTDALAAPRNEIFAVDGFSNYPEVARDEERDRYLAISWFNAGNPDVAGHLIQGDGTPLGQRIDVAATSGFEGGDGIGLAFDSASDTYLAVFQGPETPGVAQEAWAAPVSAEGVPSPEFQVTQALPKNGVYQPRVAADGNGRFLVVTVVDYTRIDGRFVRAPVEAGTAGGGGAGGTGGSVSSGGSVGSGAAPTGGSAGTGGRRPSGDDDGGCGCRTRPTRHSNIGLLFASLLALGRRRCARR